MCCRFDRTPPSYEMEKTVKLTKARKNHTNKLIWNLIEIAHNYKLISLITGKDEEDSHQHCSRSGEEPQPLLALPGCIGREPLGCSSLSKYQSSNFDPIQKISCWIFEALGHFLKLIIMSFSGEHLEEAQFENRPGQSLMREKWIWNMKICDEKNISKDELSFEKWPESKIWFCLRN